MSNICIGEGCNKISSYGLKLKKPLYCKKCSSSDMFDVRSKRCNGEGCNKIPSYGLEKNKESHCKKCSLFGMFNVKSKRCKGNNCSKIPLYGLETGKPIYCNDCKLSDMFNVKAKRCANITCDKTSPTYGLESNKKLLYCSKCKTPDMINLIAKRCKTCNKTNPSYGLEKNKGLYCNKCKLPGMFDTKGYCCLGTNCDKMSPNYGIMGGKRTHCNLCKLPGMVDIKSKRCETCNMSIVNPNYKPNCSRCHFYLYPDDPRIYNYKTKEHAFMIPLLKKYPDMVLDKAVTGGCSKRRPDGLIDCLTHSVIIEIDENQHIGYDKTCNNRRNTELYQDLGSRPIIFVRLNPDSYKIDNTRTKSAFILSKSGELVINKKQFNDRLDMLYDIVGKSVKNIPTKTITTIELFYSDL